MPCMVSFIATCLHSSHTSSRRWCLESVLASHLPQYWSAMTVGLWVEGRGYWVAPNITYAQDVPPDHCNEVIVALHRPQDHCNEVIVVLHGPPDHCNEIIVVLHGPQHHCNEVIVVLHGPQHIIVALHGPKVHCIQSLDYWNLRKLNFSEQERSGNLF